MTPEHTTLIDIIMNYWQMVFLYAFKYLKDIDSKLDILHTDNKVNKNDIKHLEAEINGLKGWIQRVEGKIN